MKTRGEIKTLLRLNKHKPARISGYTIVEVMIFLAVSMASLGGAMALVSNQRDQAEFRGAVEDIESKLRDILNDVATGYYANPGGFECKISGGNVDIDGSTPKNQGTNSPCIFVGRAIQFGTSADPNRLVVYSLVGQRLTSGANPRPTTSLAEAGPIVPIAPRTSDPDIPARSEYYDLPGVFRIGWVRRDAPGSGSPSSRVIGLAMNFRGTVFAGGSELESGAVAGVQVIPVDETSSPVAELHAAQKLYDKLTVSSPGPAYICLDSELDDKSVIFSIGSINNQASIDSEVVAGPCSSI